MIIVVGSIFAFFFLIIISFLIGDTFRKLLASNSYYKESSGTDTFKTFVIGLAILIAIAVLYNKCTHGG